MPKVFISYRRDDSQHQADRIFDALKRVVLKKNLFIDIDGIPVGVNFVDHLNKQVEQCDVLLALIGPEWLNSTSAGGQRRLDDPKDFVRIEIAAALKRGITVAPVLLDGATMPLEQNLPAGIAELAQRNATEIRRNSFDADTQRMIEKLGLREKGGKALAIAAGVGGLAVVAGIVAWALLVGNGANEAANAPLETKRDQLAEQASVSDKPLETKAVGQGIPAAAPAQVAPELAPAKPPEKPIGEALVAAPAAAAKPPVSCTDCPILTRQKIPGGNQVEATALITLGDWRLFCASVACGEWDRTREAQLPVTGITWKMAQQYIDWLAARAGRKLRLPTVAEAEGLMGEAPSEGRLGYSEWTGACHGDGVAQCADYEVRGWDQKGRRIADWHPPTAKGSSMGFRVVAVK